MSSSHFLSVLIRVVIRVRGRGAEICPPPPEADEPRAQEVDPPSAETWTCPIEPI